MRALVLLLLMTSFPLWADNASELLAGEKFADQYFRPPPATGDGVLAIANVMGSAPEMRNGTPMFKAGAIFQLYVQSYSLLEALVTDSDKIDQRNLEIELLWQTAVDQLKGAKITPDEFSKLTNDPRPNCLNSNGNPYPDAQAVVDQDEKFKAEMAAIQLKAARDEVELDSGNYHPGQADSGSTNSSQP